ncbi:MAG: hypothetical protein ACLP70_19535 [Streptosporangiaceae bacterium]|jgi:hypothetical protein
MFYTLLGIVSFIVVIATAYVWNVIQGFGWCAVIGAVPGAVLAWPCNCRAGYFSLDLSTRNTTCTTTGFPLVHLRTVFEFGPVYVEHAQVVVEGALIGALVAGVLAVAVFAIIDGIRKSAGRRGKSAT